MLDLTYYTRTNQTVNVTVSEASYERLAFAGLAKIVNYSEVEINIEDETYTVNATELNFENRVQLLFLIEKERQVELENLFKSMDEKPTIKEFRDNFDYVKTLTNLYELFKDEENIFFSYE